MINSRIFWLYLAGGIMALALIITNVVMFYPVIKTSSVVVESILAIFFFYMANKSYHEKKDKDLM